MDRALWKMFAALSAALMLAAVAGPAVAQQPASADLSALANLIQPRAVMMTITPGPMSGGNAAFTVPYSAKVYGIGGVDFAAVSTMNKPLSGTFNASSARGLIKTADAMPAKAVIDYANRSSIPVAGAAAVVVMQDFAVTGASGNKLSFQFGKVSMYLPDGTTKSYKLDRPVKMTYDLGQMAMSIEGDQVLTKAMAELFKSGATFPAGAGPAKLDHILAAIK